MVILDKEFNILLGECDKFIPGENLDYTYSSSLEEAWRKDIIYCLDITPPQNYTSGQYKYISGSFEVWEHYIEDKNIYASDGTIIGTKPTSSII